VKAETTQATANMGKTLIVYYSYTNKCHEIVTTLSSQIEADVVRIEPAEKGLRYEANNYALGTQLLNAIKANPNDASSYPAIDPVNVNLSDYQNIIIVTPLWWSQMAAIMQTYLFNNSAQMAGKTVAMIVSSHSSGISGVVADAQRLLPNVTWAGDALWINNANHSNRSSLIQNWLPTQNFQTSSDMTQKLYLTIGGVTKTATLVSNSSTEALVAQLQQGNITYEAHDYGNFEKVGPLGYTFPENNEQINTVPGDLILYQGSNLCIYYDTNSWNFTRIGKLDNMTQADIKTWVNAGGDNVSVTLSISQPTGISQIKTDETKSQAYTLTGTLAQAGYKGVVIMNGKKVIR
jgi:flavodoxin